MISLDVKAQSKASSPTALAVSNEAIDEPEVSFSALLHGAKNSKDDKEIQNGSFVLALETKEDLKDIKSIGSKETLLSLLKNDSKLGSEDSIKESIEVLQLNPQVTEKLSATELKTLIIDAKQFLKTKIMQSDDFKMSQVKDLPKTLKGLSDMAKSLGIDMNKITLQEVKATPKDVPAVKDINKFTLQEEVKKVPKEVSTVKNTTKFESEEPVKVKPTALATVKTPVDTKVVQEEIKFQDKKSDTLKEVKATPLFKAQEKTELTTEQIVQTKQFKVEDKTSKTKADEMLKLLLRGEKPVNTSVTMTADFSVATARVIAPTATTEVGKSLEQLLKGAPEESTSKLDGLSTHKADSFEVKLNEAKQMIKYLSQDVKTAIEDYKSPFTRVKVQLNPAKMGEVDITIVSRGKNLHVNISSNTAAINTLTINANELKTQLNTSGINNASLNFSNSDQNAQQQTSQQERNRQNEREADEEYSYFDNEEQNEEILSSLEIVVPNYA